MLKLSIIAAISANRVIGFKNIIPWNIPSDLQSFKKITLNKPIIMGRNTWDSLPKKPLINRLNVVLSNTLSFTEDCGAEVFNSFNKALNRAEEWAYSNKVSEIIVIGGGQVYKEALPYIKKIYLTRISIVLPGDVYFPNINFSNWKLISRTYNVNNNYHYSDEIWEK